MKPWATGLISGCGLWVILVGLLSTCLVPVALIMAGLTSNSDFVVQNVGGQFCPADSTPSLQTYATSTRDENGMDIPSTAYELVCLDPSGQILENQGPGYAFVWTGILSLGGLLLSGLLALVLAGPIGALASRLLGQKKEQMKRAGAKSAS